VQGEMISNELLHGSRVGVEKIGFDRNMHEFETREGSSGRGFRGAMTRKTDGKKYAEFGDLPSEGSV